MYTQKSPEAKTDLPPQKLDLRSLTFGGQVTFKVLSHIFIEFVKMRSCGRTFTAYAA